jgi:glycerol-3-phosphate dehydrogenase
VEFIYPLERKGIDRGYVGLGVGVYDVLGAGRGVPSHHKHLSKRKTLESFPDGKKGHIQGAIKFYEGQLDDARHTMMLARTAAAYGAQVATSARVVDLIRNGERVVGATDRRVDRRHPGDDRREGKFPGAGLQGCAHRGSPGPDQVQHRADHRDREEPAVHHPVPVE